MAHLMDEDQSEDEEMAECKPLKIQFSPISDKMDEDYDEEMPELEHLHTQRIRIANAPISAITGSPMAKVFGSVDMLSHILQVYIYVQFSLSGLLAHGLTRV
jgi:hypothetical protein